MKKQILLSFLAGAVVPLLLAALYQGTPPSGDVERGGLSPVAEERQDSAVILTVKTRTGNLQQMDLEEYLLGVVLAEMPADFDSEALKAQAVVARTYTRKRMEGSKHEGAAVCMDPACCQSWKSEEAYLDQGGRRSSVEKVRQAVTDTDGMVLCYDGKLIDATYFSCSGGSTEDAVAVWGRDVPYLQAVESPGEENAPRYSETVTISVSEFCGKLGIPEKTEGLLGAVRHTGGGGVETMVIAGQEFTGTQLRSKLGLRSTAFEMVQRGNNIEITTRGFGHRVGMSQYGAQAMAKAGSTYAQILAHYYTGAELVRTEE